MSHKVDISAVVDMADTISTFDTKTVAATLRKLASEVFELHQKLENADTEALKAQLRLSKDLATRRTAQLDAIVKACGASPDCYKGQPDKLYEDCVRVIEATKGRERTMNRTLGQLQKAAGGASDCRGLQFQLSRATDATSDAQYCLQAGNNLLDQASKDFDVDLATGDCLTIGWRIGKLIEHFKTSQAKIHEALGFLPAATTDQICDHIKQLRRSAGSYDEQLREAQLKVSALSEENRALRATRTMVEFNLDAYAKRNALLEGQLKDTEARCDALDRQYRVTEQFNETHKSRAEALEAQLRQAEALATKRTDQLDAVVKACGASPDFHKGQPDKLYEDCVRVIGATKARERTMDHTLGQLQKAAGGASDCRGLFAYGDEWLPQVLHVLEQRACAKGLDGIDSLKTYLGMGGCSVIEITARATRILTSQNEKIDELVIQAQEARDALYEIQRTCGHGETMRAEDVVKVVKDALAAQRMRGDNFQDALARAHDLLNQAEVTFSIDLDDTEDNGLRGRLTRFIDQFQRRCNETQGLIARCSTMDSDIAAIYAYAGVPRGCAMGAVIDACVAKFASYQYAFQDLREYLGADASASPAELVSYVKRGCCVNGQFELLKNRISAACVALDMPKPANPCDYVAQLELLVERIWSYKGILSQADQLRADSATLGSVFDALTKIEREEGLTGKGLAADRINDLAGLVRARRHELAQVTSERDLLEEDIRQLANALEVDIKQEGWGTAMLNRAKQLSRSMTLYRTHLDSIGKAVDKAGLSYVDLVEYIRGAQHRGAAE